MSSISTGILKRNLTKSGSLLLLLQRGPLVQMLLPEATLSGVSIGSQAMLTVATVAGLGAYDTVAGATVVQQSPAANSTTVPCLRGVYIDAVFYDTDSHTPAGWRIASGTLPTGLTLNSVANRTFHVTGTPSTAGSSTVKLESTDGDNPKPSGTFTFTVSSASVTVSPVAISMLSGGQVTLTATPTGAPPYTYQWYQGAAGTTSTPVGTGATFTTPALATTTQYWVRCTDSGSPANTMDSTASTVTVVPTTAKAATGTDLTAAGSWSGGVPTAATAGLWNGTSLAGGLTFGTAASWIGLAVTGGATDISVTGAGTLTLGSLGFDLSASPVNMTWATPVAISANQTWKVNAAKTLTVSGAVSAASGYSLTKEGTGTISLDGTNTYTGGTIVKAGTLRIGGAGKLGSGTYSNIINNSGVFQYSSSAAQTLSGVISNTGSLVKDTGAGTLTLSAANTYTGTTTVSAGTLEIGGTAGLLSSTATAGTYAGNIILANNATLQFSTTSTTAQTLSGIISGTGNITKSAGTLDLTLSGANTFTGTVTCRAGRLSVVRNADLGNTANTVNLDGGSLRHVSGGTALSRPFSIGTSGGTLDISSSYTDTITSLSGTGALTKSGSTGGVNISGPSTFSGNIVLSTGTLAITGNGTLGSGNYTGSIANSSTFRHSSSANQTLAGSITGAGALVKDTSTTSILTLTGTHGFTGTTTLSTGSLIVNGTLATAANAVTTSSGTTLGGTGIIQRPVTVNGTLAPGNGAGTLSVTGAAAVNGPYAVEINGPAADKLAVTGNLALGAASSLTISLLGGGFTQAGYVIAECTGGTISGTFANVPAGYKVTYTSTQAVLALDSSIVSIAVSPATVAEDGALNLTYTVTRTGSTALPLTVNLGYSGTATAGSDYSTPPATVIIPAASLNASVTIDPAVDSTVEPDETVIVSLVAGSGYTLGSPATATATITNDDTAYSSWASGLPPEQRAMNLTPQNDGVSNLLKFAFNMNPATPDVRRLRFGAGDTEGLPAASLAGNRLRLEYIRRSATTNPGITYLPQIGSDLNGWGLALSNESVTPIGGGAWERVTVDGPVGQTSCFGRVKVTSP